MNDLTIRVDLMLGSSKIEHRNRFVDGRMVMESRRIDRDRSGQVTHTGEWLGCGASIGWDDGSPFTAADYRALSQ